MNVIRRKTLKAFWEVHPQAETPLKVWFKTCRKARWNSFAELKMTRGDADQARIKVGSVTKTVTIFDVGGNKFRVISLIDYRRQTMLVTHVLTHNEYDTGQWKKQI